MLTLPSKVRVFVAVKPVDMRKQFDGLANVVREALDEDPETGHLYVFANRRRHLRKILFFDQQGYCILAKRLESGTFPIPKQDQETIELKAEDLAKLLRGKTIAIMSS